VYCDISARTKEKTAEEEEEELASSSLSSFEVNYV